jgi:hypothetical protein
MRLGGEVSLASDAPAAPRRGARRAASAAQL